MSTVEELVRRSQQGDIAAFEELISQHQQKTYNIAYRLMGNHHDAGDLAQEALIKVYKSIGSFRYDSSFSTWVYHIVTNVCRDELRKRSRHQVSYLDEPVSLYDGEVHKEVADDTFNPEDAYERKESAEYIQGLINTLNPEYRMVIILREMLGLSYEEIAQELDITLGTVKSRLNRARKYLKERIVRGGENPSSDTSRVLREGGN
ncbi:RNA polymerase sigma factor [Dehalobacterium formicoaceticum]|uniref:Sigma-70 family RNA polymerase sigma factor n=1 Tax=Dehalobacterium formicoaceticum TaxID=51515 RepID=A0ABT1Y5X6_9FIRM|nr:sigma-70 family RNA polymerase sigma factor [Dehalobacterium formicoaceticum]MCR6546292.1 sigma-70 family RNA polymerase sigma factor [Dehalobacterium formicoaceticum]